MQAPPTRLPLFLLLFCLPVSAADFACTSPLRTSTPATFLVRIQANTMAVVRGPISDHPAIVFTGAAKGSRGAAGDFNGDGAADLALLANGRITIYSNDGRGRFTQGVELPIPAVANVTAGDANNDGNADLVLGGRYTAVLAGNGDGTFRNVRVAHEQPQSVFAAMDLDGDAIDEVITHRGTVARFLGGGSVTLESLVPPNTSEVVGAADGKVLAADRNTLRVYSRRSGTWQEVQRFNADFVDTATVVNGRIAFIAGNDLYIVHDGAPVLVAELEHSRQFEMQASDLDRDGEEELIVLREGNTGSSFDPVPVPGSPTGHILVFRGSGPAEVIFDERVMRDMDVGDFNGDGVLDLIVATNERTSYFAGPAFAGPQAIAPPGRIAVADANGDGIDDFAISSEYGTQLYRGTLQGPKFEGSWLAAGDGSVAIARPIAFARTRRAAPPSIISAMPELVTCGMRRRGARH